VGGEAGLAAPRRQKKKSGPPRGEQKQPPPPPPPQKKKKTAIRRLKLWRRNIILTSHQLCHQTEGQTALLLY